MVKCWTSKLSHQDWEYVASVLRLSHNVQYGTLGTTNSNTPSLKRSEVVPWFSLQCQMPLSTILCSYSKHWHYAELCFSLPENGHWHLLVCACPPSRVCSLLNGRFNYGLQLLCYQLQSKCLECLIKTGLPSGIADYHTFAFLTWFIFLYMYI